MGLVLALLTIFLVAGAIKKKRQSLAIYTDEGEFLETRAAETFKTLMDQIKKVRKERTRLNSIDPTSVEKLSEEETEIIKHLKYEYLTAQVDVFEYEAKKKGFVSPEVKAGLIRSLSLHMNDDLSDRIMRLLTK